MEIDKEDLKHAIEWLDSIEVDSEFGASCRLWTISVLEEIQKDL